MHTVFKKQGPYENALGLRIFYRQQESKIEIGGGVVGGSGLK